MATIIANHKVADFNSWLPYYTEDEWRRKAAGLKDVKVLCKIDDPNHVYMIWETDNPSKAEQMAKDPELAVQMKKAGVVSALEIVVLK
jgi:hypothetical protein